MKRETVYSITELLVILIDHIMAYPAVVLLLEMIKASVVDTSSPELPQLVAILLGMSSWNAVLLIWVVLYFLYAGLFFVNKYVRKIDGQGRTKRALNPAVDAIILVVCMYLSQGTNMPWWPGFVQFIIVCGLYVVFMYMCHFQDFLMVSDGNVGKSATKSVLRTGMISVAIFAVVIMVVLTAIVCVPAVRELIDAFAMWIRDTLFFRGQGETLDDLGMYHQEAMGDGTVDKVTPVTPLWLVIIEILASVILTAFIVIGLTALIKLLISSIMDAIKASKPSHMELDERIIDDVTDEVENLSVKERRSLKDFVEGIRLSPAQKIRKLYQKYVASNRDFLEKELGGKSVEKATAREVVTVGTVSDDVVELYERARYSNDEIVADDYKKMKQYMK